jgi:zinc protease
MPDAQPSAWAANYRRRQLSIAFDALPCRGTDTLRAHLSIGDSMSSTFPFSRRVAALLIGLFIAAGGHAAVPPGVAQGPSIEGITEYKLANGLTVLLFPDASKPTTTVNVTYQVGSAYENYGETGMAHLLEHLVFKGTPTRGNIMTELGKRGMNFNGSTGWDRTNYFESFTASDESLDWALAMEADRMVNSYIRRSDLDPEMTVVRNEFENGENNPQLVLFGKMLAAAYEWHNYAHMPIGARSDIENVNIERLQAFYRQYYQPDNAVLIVAGRFDPDPTLRLIAKYFGPIPKPKRKLPPIYTQEPVQDGERSVTLRRVGNAKYLGMMFHTVRGPSPDYIATDALGEVLTITPAGRLYKALVETKKATNVEVWQEAQKDPGSIAFFAQIPEGESIEPAREAMRATFENLKNEPITEAEVARVRAKAAKYYDDVISDPQKLGVALSEAIAIGDWRLFFIQRDRYRSVAAADVQRVALAYLKPSNLTVGEFIPDPKPDRAPVPPTVDVAALVKDYKGDPAAVAGETFDTSPVNLDARTQRFVLANGMKVALLPKKTRGAAVDFALDLHYADEKSAFGKQIVGTMTGSMLLRGAGKRDRQQIEDALDQLRAKVDVHGSVTGTSVSGQTFNKELPDTLRLVADVLRAPTFPPAELDNLKRESTTSLESTRTDPRQIAQRALRRNGNPYLNGDPRYVATLDEEIAAVRAVTPESVTQFHDQFYGASNAELAIVGDFDPAAMRALVTELFGSWKSPGAYARVPNPLLPNKPGDLKFEAPDKSNAFLMAREALPVNDTSPDYPALLLANYILGDSPSSRLWERLRQKEGLSYGVGSFFRVNSFEANSSLGIYAIFAPQNLEKIRKGFSEELQLALKNGFTETELKHAKEGLLQERTLSRSEDQGVAGELVQQAYLGRTWANDGAIDAAIAKLTVADVNAVLRKYLKPDQLAYSFAGDFDKK